MAPEYKGPCKIMEKLSSSTFIIQRLSDNVNLGKVNADRKKSFYERVQIEQSDPKPIQEQEESRNTTSQTIASTGYDSSVPTTVRTSNRTRRAPVRYDY
jgi:hypothetical protein